MSKIGGCLKHLIFKFYPNHIFKLKIINLPNCEISFFISLQDISLTKEDILAFTYNFTICFNWYSMNTYSVWFRVSSPHIFHLFFFIAVDEEYDVLSQ